MSSSKDPNVESQAHGVWGEKNPNYVIPQSNSDTKAGRNGSDIGDEQFWADRGNCQGEYRELYAGQDRSFGGILGQLIALSESRIAQQSDQLAEERAYLELLKHFQESIFESQRVTPADQCDRWGYSL